jgi:hypothetical protein
MSKKGLEIIGGDGTGTGKTPPVTKLLIGTVPDEPQPAGPAQVSLPVRMSVGAVLEGFDPEKDLRLHRIQVRLGSVGTLVCLGRERGKLLWETIEAGDQVKTTIHGKVTSIIRNNRQRNLPPLTEDEIPTPGEGLTGFDPERNPFEQVLEIKGRTVTATNVSWEAILWEDQRGQLAVTTDLEGIVQMGFADM